MKLFHVSEESDIDIFKPRIPDRDDLDKNIGLVWAIDECRLPNFLTPRGCPRVTYHIGANTSKHDVDKFFSSPTVHHAVIIENKWFKQMKHCKLYLYEFDPTDFILQDEVAGYYVAKTIQIPLQKLEVDDVFSALFNRNVEVRLVDNLWGVANQVKSSTLNWSLCKMGYAQPAMQK